MFLVPENVLLSIMSFSGGVWWVTFKIFHTVTKTFFWILNFMLQILLNFLFKKKNDDKMVINNFGPKFRKDFLQCSLGKEWIYQAWLGLQPTLFQNCTSEAVWRQNPHTSLYSTYTRILSNTSVCIQGISFKHFNCQSWSLMLFTNLIHLAPTRVFLALRTFGPYKFGQHPGLFGLLDIWPLYMVHFGLRTFGPYTFGPHPGLFGP